jgi:hypothetical protein
MNYDDFESWAIHDNNAVGLQLDELNKFIEYWTNKPPKAKKMAFEKEKNFVMKLRLQTWKRNYERNTKNNHQTSKVGHAIQVFNSLNNGINGNAKSDIEFL